MASIQIRAERGPGFMRSCHFGLNASIESPSATATNCGSGILCTKKFYRVRLRGTKAQPPGLGRCDRTRDTTSSKRRAGRPHYCRVEFGTTFHGALRRPMDRPRDALFDFWLLLTTVKLLRVPTPANPAPIAAFTAHYCRFRMSSFQQYSGVRRIGNSRRAAPCTHLSESVPTRCPNRDCF